MSAIAVRGVSKTYRIPHERHTTLTERLLSVFRPVGVETLAALQDVTLDVPDGTFVGVIGANGSGKSTLLKIMAGLIVPDSGTIAVNGSVSPLLELGLGFNNELTVRENATLYGAVLGYPRKEIDRRVDEVIAFAGLERFRDAKLKSLSSGMLVRLAFATALRADADILLLDEVLAVGDAQFQRKCVDVFLDLKRQRKTIVLVSHDLMAVQRFCEKVFWLDKGRLELAGEAEDVIGAYMTLSQTQGLRSVRESYLGKSKTFESRFGDERIRVVEGHLEDDRGTPVTHVPAGSRIVLRLVVDAFDACAQPVFGLIVRLGSQVVYSTTNVVLGVDVPALAPGARLDVSVAFTAALANGHYSVNVAVAGADGTIHDWINDFTDFIVHRSRCTDGVADLDADFRAAARDVRAALADARRGS